jgi:hypothetical protein
MPERTPPDPCQLAATVLHAAADELRDVARTADQLLGSTQQLDAVLPAELRAALLRPAQLAAVAHWLDARARLYADPRRATDAVLPLA